MNWYQQYQEERAKAQLDEQGTEYDQSQSKLLKGTNQDPAGERLTLSSSKLEEVSEKLG
jgi:hypothetical protein